MTTELSISNLFCYAEATIDFEPGPTLITGKNSSGKTSLAYIIGALVSHSQNPAGLSAASAKAYVRDGSIEGSALLDGVEWAPPGGLTIPIGAKPSAPPHAVGLVDFFKGRTKNDRAKVWEGMFLPEDPESILRPGLEPSREPVSGGHRTDPPRRVGRCQGGLPRSPTGEQETVGGNHRRAIRGPESGEVEADRMAN